MKNLIGFLTVMALAFGMIACAKKKSGGGSSPTPVVPVAPVIPVNVGPIAYAMQNKPSTVLGNQTSFSVGSAYTEFLQQFLATCDRADLWNTGAASCMNWANGYNMIRLSLPSQTSNQPQVTAFSAPLMNAFNFDFSFGWDNGSLPQNPLRTIGTINAVNANAGFQVRTQGPNFALGYNKVLILKVENGHLGDSYLQVSLVLRDQNQNDTQIGSGTMYRCASVSCGLPF